MPLGTEVDLGPGHIVLDGDPAPPRKGHSSPPLFGSCPLWPPLPMSATAELLFQQDSTPTHSTQFSCCCAKMPTSFILSNSPITVYSLTRP